jgi:hypothetical protein
MEGPYKCELCWRVLEDKMTQYAFENWDWFRGYFPETVYFCQEHKNSARRQELFRLSQIAPSKQDTVAP